MRRLVAQVLAAVTGLMLLLMAGLFGVMQNRGATAPHDAVTPTPAADDGAAQLLARGREVFDEQDCAVCHSIAGAGNRRNPLDDVGTRLEEDDIRRWIVDPRSMDPAVRKPAYDHLGEEDLEALVAYLAAQRGPPAP